MHNLHVAYIKLMSNVWNSTKFWDHFVIWQRIPTYCSVFVTYWKRISNLFSVHQRTWWIFICPHTLVLTYLNVCITYPLRTSNACLTYKQYVGMRWRFFYASSKFWDLFAVWQRIPTYSSVFVTCLKLISDVFSVAQRTCLISHTSAYVGATCHVP